MGLNSTFYFATVPYYIKGFEDRDEMGTTINYKKQFFKRRYLDDFDYVTFLNHGVMRGKR